ncbi:hypothetical protein [Spirillospora sp. CA-128828]|uniref:hypothetical protein n=1 Tax=Spirillospora sp. CA-128828 TaxID=3240033 RepID=UPI003D909AC4
MPESRWTIPPTDPDTSLPTDRPADWTATTPWAALDGPDCPTCQTSNTAWDGISADSLGDWWTCDHDHRFLLTPEGQAIPAEDAA